MNPYSTQQQKEVFLIDAVGEILEKEIGTNAKDVFINSNIIQQISGYPNFIQREIINRYFYGLLLTWRSTHNVPVFEIFPSLSRDGDLKYWFNLFLCDVVPFIRDNGILQSTPAIESK